MKRKTAKHHQRSKKTLKRGLTLAASVAVLGISNPGVAQEITGLTGNSQKLQLFSSDWKNLAWLATLGKFEEIERKPRVAKPTDEMDLLPNTIPQKLREDIAGEKPLNAAKLTGTSTFEFYDINSARTFQFHAKRSELASFSRLISEDLGQNKPKNESKEEPSKLDIELEDVRNKSWSNSHDSRIRRGTSDGFPDNHSIYQSIANYGGCTANILTATQTRMVAITAAHCIFRPGNVFSGSKLQPRANGGQSSNWGSWTPYAFGYYPAYVDNNCEDNWSGSRCIKHDIALVIASRDAGASVPRGMGWGYRSKSSLDQFNKYRRGYPGCGFAHSPLNCNTNTLYGDGRLSVANFSHQDHDNWNRQIRFSSDLNPGDSGSGLYYYRNNHPYVFAVTSAEPAGCKTNCTSSQPNYARRITPQFFDFINSVVF